jgi:hypothetical protein
MKHRGHPLSDSYLQAVGDVIVSFNYLEDSVRQIFQVILAPNLAGRVICAKIGFRQLREFTLAVYQSVYDEDDDYRKLDELCSEIERIEEERNRVAHCTWTSGRFDPTTSQHLEIGTFQTKIAKKRALRYDFIKISLDDLKDIAKRIRSLNWRVSEFHHSHFERRKYHYVHYQEKG